MSTVQTEVSNGIATITLQRPKTLNAITMEDYDTFAAALREIDKREDVLVTVWQATGKWFCAGTNVQLKREHDSSVRNQFIDVVSRSTTDCGQALYSHSKILIAALNGPVMGISAAFLGYFDFIYSLPNSWLMLPFSFLGLVAEGGASVSFVNRMGLAKANEVLLWGKKKEAQELKECGFINKIFPPQPVEEFHASVRRHITAELEGLDPISLLTIKKLIKAGLNAKNDHDATNLRESYAQADRFASGVPAKRFGQLAAKEIRHKL